MKFINIHTHQTTDNESVISLLNNYPTATNFNNYFSVGIHPWHISESEIDTEISLIKKQLQHKNCFAIGECGLDRLSEVNLQLQIAVFKKHIALSEKHQKPLIIHCVRAFQEIIQLKKETKATQPWIIHGFNKNKQVATALLKAGFLLSFGKALINSNKIKEVFLETPLEKIFLETDDSNYTIFDIYKKAAEIRKINIEKLQETIYQNFNSIFTK
ncbi:MAG: TatD family hydrolase [Tenacibaculum sp.]